MRGRRVVVEGRQRNEAAALIGRRLSRIESETGRCKTLTSHTTGYVQGTKENVGSSGPRARSGQTTMTSREDEREEKKSGEGRIALGKETTLRPARSNDSSVRFALSHDPINPFYPFYASRTRVAPLPHAGPELITQSAIPSGARGPSSPVGSPPYCSSGMRIMRWTCPLQLALLSRPRASSPGCWVVSGARNCCSGTRMTISALAATLALYRVTVPGDIRGFFSHCGSAGEPRFDVICDGTKHKETKDEEHKDSTALSSINGSTRWVSKL